MAKKNKKTSQATPEESKSLLEENETLNENNPIDTADTDNVSEVNGNGSEHQTLHSNGKSKEDSTKANGSDSKVVEHSEPADAIELATLHDEAASLKSTDAVLETTKEDLDSISHQQQQVSEQELNPDLAQYMHACQEGNLTVVKELISSKTIAASDTFSDGITGLHWACINNRLTIVKYLTGNEYSTADPNQLGGELKATPLHWACRNGLVYIVDYLISNTSADPTIRDTQSYNALHLAVHSSNITLITYILLTCCETQSKKKIYVDEPDSFNRTSLHWAAYQGDVLTISALLKFGADVTKVDNTLFIPLHWAFMKGHKSVLKTLVEAGSDIHAKNDQGKDTFEIAKDMNCTKTWTQALIENDRDPKLNWGKRRKVIQPKLAKLITFFSPYIILPAALYICSFSQGFWIPKLFFATIVFAGGLWAVLKLVIPIYLIEDAALARSPILAGIFSASVFWVVSLWIFKILPATFFSHFFSNVVLAGLVGICMWSFFKSMFINPGYVPVPSDKSVILNQVKDLISEGKFDTDHFCVESLVRKPLRSKYSRHSGRLIARFDHYCPWVYNDIGVRNHKLFMAFVYSLNLAILLFVRLSLKYFDKFEDGYDSDFDERCLFLSDDLCYGFENHHFHYNFVAWALLQYIWVMFLCAVQTFQIFKGLTTREFSMMNKRMERNRNNHATLPRDFGAEDTPPPEAPANGPGLVHRDNGFKMCMKLLGLDQFIMTIKLSLGSLPLIASSPAATIANYETLNTFNIPTDYGIKQNFLDFWVLGDLHFRNVFYLPIEGENNLNGQVVDYYKLYEYPAKSAGDVV